ncbi:MAG: dihydroorotase [Spirochaetia bacterium]|nr:dihydroorotase [Spirochaetia bacterium]
MSNNTKYILPGVKAVLPEKKEPEACDILINTKDGLIEKIDKHLRKEEDAVFLEEFEGMVVFPGFIDPHVHFRVPGKSEAEDWLNGSKAALSAGITTVLDMPNNNPPVTNLKSYESKKDIVNQNSLINFGLFGGLTKDNIDELKKIKTLKGIKVYMASTTGDMLLENIMNIDTAGDMLFAFHAEDEKIIQENTKKWGHEINIYNHTKIRGEKAAVSAVKQVVELQKKTSGKFHLCHASSPQEIDLLSDTKISHEVCAHHLFLDTSDYENKEFLLKCNPPIREKETAGNLRKALYEERIEMIATDHAPHLIEEKQETSKWPPSGIPSIEAGTHLILNELFSGKLNFNYVSKILSSNAAKRFNIKKRGEIKEGNFADLAVIHEEMWTLSKGDIYSKCGWNGFEGFTFNSKVIASFVNGFLYKRNQLDEIIYRPKEACIFEV